MRIVNKEHKISYFDSKLLSSYFGGLRWCVFDIESMGLNPKYDGVILAAIMEVEEDGSCSVTQYFLDSFEEESTLLAVIRDELNKYDVMLTFNGKHFDIPFIKTRAKVLGLRELTLEEYDIKPYNFDLYLLLYGHSELKKLLPNLKQKTVEGYMGLGESRDDEISGAESVKLFKEYMYSFDEAKREELSEKILLHNHDDVMQLYRLLPVIRKTNFHRGMSYLGFPVLGINGYRDLIVEKVRIDSDKLTANGRHREDFSYISFDTAENEMNIQFKKDGTFTISIPLIKINKGNIRAQVINVRKIRADEKDFEGLGNFANGFLIVKVGDKENYLEQNTIVRSVLTDFMRNYPR